MAEIILKNVNYQYPLEEKEVVCDFTYCFEQGKVYGLIGENESGKSTLLEAIKVVLNQQYRTTDKSILAELFNRDDIKKFGSSSINVGRFI